MNDKTPLATPYAGLLPKQVRTGRQWGLPTGMTPGKQDGIAAFGSEQQATSTSRISLWEQGFRLGLVSTIMDTLRRRWHRPEGHFFGPALSGSRKLKIWVPMPVFEALTLVAETRDVSRPTLIRQLLHTHLFGRVALEQELRETDDIRFSRRDSLFSLPDRDPDKPKLPLGKSIADALVLVSDDIHSGLQQLAKRHRQPLGTYAAYVLCWAMFGRGVYAGLAMRVTQGMWLGDEHDEPGAAGESR